MTAETIHTCSYYCERPECIRRQRDELRDRLESVLASAPPSAPEPEVHSYDPTEQRQSVTIRWPDGKCLGYVLDRTRYTDNLPPSAPVGVDAVMVPKEPSEGVLVSMAIRYDHGLGVPGYYDQPLFGGENGGHKRRMESTVAKMRQLYEEVVGAGFYSREREEEYAALAQQPAAGAVAGDAAFLRHIASVCRGAFDLCRPKPQRTPEDVREHYGELCLSELANIADEIERRLAAAEGVQPEESRSVAHQLLHWGGVPVHVTGTVTTSPGNWSLIDAAIAAQHQEPTT